MTADNLILELQEINTFYGKFHVLHDLSMRVEEGEIVMFVGQNGTGKTTALKSIMGIEPPRDGVVKFRGDDITKLPPYKTYRRGISFVPGDRRLFPKLTVRQNLRMGYGRGEGENGFREQLETVYQFFPNLEERSGQLAQRLSGGEKEMLAIGRGLMSNPDLMLLDEPTEGLMPSIVDTFADVITLINEQGVSILIVEHNLDFAFQISDYAYIIDQGQITWHGDSDVLQQDDTTKDRYLAI